MHVCPLSEVYFECFVTLAKVALIVLCYFVFFLCVLSLTVDLV